MEIIQYNENIKEDTIIFLKKVFKENDRKLLLNEVRNQDILNIKKNYLKNGNFWCLLNDKKEICGTIGLRHLENYYEIRRFFISKPYQKKGFGKKLLNVAIDYSIQNSYKILRAATMYSGKIAQAIFYYYGFKQIERYNNSTADIFFELELNRSTIYQFNLRKLNESFQKSLILNPTENIPSLYKNNQTELFEGLYVSERFKDVNDKVIFAGRNNYIEFFQFIKEEWKKEFHAEDVDLKTLSGLNAHLIFFLCILKPGDKVMLLPEVCGGHFATEQILKNIGADVCLMIPDYQNLCVDINKTIELIKKEKINYLFVDRSEGLYYEDFSWLKQFTSIYKIFDASQYISSIICGRFTNPFDMGFDLIVSTLHKNFPGPQKGIFATKNKNDFVWNQYLSQAKTYISNTHPKGIADSILPILEKNKFREYCIITENCVKLLEEKLILKKVPVVKRKKKHVFTQHLWILCDTKEESYQYYLKLETLNLLTNYRLLPYNLGYGLRIGLNAAVLSGLNENNIEKLSDLMSEAYHNDLTDSLQMKCAEFIQSIKFTAK